MRVYSSFSQSTRQTGVSFGGERKVFAHNLDLERRDYLTDQERTTLDYLAAEVFPTSGFLLKSPWVFDSHLRKRSPDEHGNTRVLRSLEEKGYLESRASDAYMHFEWRLSAKGRAYQQRFLGDTLTVKAY